jgi:CysZ protein
MNGFMDGVRLAGRGWGWWRRRSGLMLLGLLPAVVVGFVLLMAVIALIWQLGAIGDWLTPFADDWSPGWQRLAELTAQAVVLAGVLVLIVVTFTGLTLAVGEPIYDRIWRTVELDTTGVVPTGSVGFWRGAVDGLGLIVRGIVVGALTALLGVIPVVGTVLGWLVGLACTGWLLAAELTSRALLARGIERRERARLIRAQRGKALGFGVATQVCFLVPGGAVATMPAAVVGSTLLAQSLVGATRRPDVPPATS